MTIFAELTPYITPGSDTGNYTVARQQYRLSTSGYQMLLEQLWRWDTGGIWRQ